MLQSIRDHTQGWIAGVIISLLILSFALWGIHSYLVGSTSNSSVASVNGTEITQGQLAVAYERLRRQLQNQYSSNYELPANAVSDLKNRALQTLINIQVLKQSSYKQNYRVSNRQVDSYLESIPEFQVDGQFSTARFQQLLATTLFSTRDFLELIQTSLMIDQPRLGLIFTSFALPDEISYTISLVTQERNIQFATLAFNSLANQTISISDEKIQAYYKDHEAEFKTPEQVSIEYIAFTVKDLTSNETISDKTLKDFYNENVNSFTQPAQWKLETILVPVAETASEKEIAAAQDKAKELAEKGKTVKEFLTLANATTVVKAPDFLQGWISINKVPNELQKTIVGLTKKGEVSAPIHVQSGFVIFKVVDLKDAEVQPFEKVKDKVKDTLVHQHAEEKFNALKEQITNITYEHPDSLEPAAKELNLKVQTSNLFSKDKGGNDITGNTKIREAAFSNDVLNLQNNSDVIQLNPDSVMVLRVKSHVPATTLPLKTVEKQITDKLKETEIENKTAELANQIVAKLQSGASIQDVAKQYQLTWNNVGFIGRHAGKIDSAILDTAFAMPKPEQNKLTFANTKMQKGYAIIVLNAVRDSSANKTKDQYKVYGEQIQNSLGLLEYELYKQSLMNRAKIKMENS